MQQELSLPLRNLEARMQALPADCDAMLLSELDGFLTGIMVCPELIMPGEWLPLVWGGGKPDVGEDGTFADTIDLNGFCQLVIAHYNDIGGDLQRGPGHFGPIYDIDPRHDDVLWEIWLGGFIEAMKLRPDCWADIVTSKDEDATTALLTLIALGGENGEAGPFTQKQIDEIIPLAPDMIPHCVEKLHAWRVGGGASKRLPVSVGAKTGRNEPCPCESGRKYKKCCGAN